MKTLKHRVYQVSLTAGLASCLLLTSCKETLKLQADWQHTKTRLDELQQRGAELDAKLVDLRKVMPGGTTPQESARRMTLRAEADIKLLDTEIAQATSRLQASEAALETLKKEIAKQSATSGS